MVIFEVFVTNSLLKQVSRHSPIKRRKLVINLVVNHLEYCSTSVKFCVNNFGQLSYLDFDDSMPFVPRPKGIFTEELDIFGNYVAFDAWV